jgi:glucose/arabinose dehydrogenase
MNRLLSRFDRALGLSLSLVLSVLAVSLVASAVVAGPPFNIELQTLVGSGLVKPVYLTHAGDGSGRLFVVELEGRIRVVKDGVLLPQPYLDISRRVNCCQEQGLFSVAFDPDYETNGAFYVNYINTGWDTVVARYVVADPAADVAEPISVTTVLSVDQPYFNHNGGQLQFGPNDGYLYIGMGDGGGPSDPENRGQALDTLLGKMLRLDVRGVTTYTIPPSNPFAHSSGAPRPEIWAIGLRNPWRFAFDRATGDLYIGDVGNFCHERVIFEPAGSPGGLNYGWRRMEGFHLFDRDDARNCNQPRVAPPDLTLPVIEYPHSLGYAVTGGYVYRGQKYPWLTGVYFYSDFGSGRIWALRQIAPGVWSSRELRDTIYALASFGEDEAGELYVMDYVGGGVYQIISDDPADRLR